MTLSIYHSLPGPGKGVSTQEGWNATWKGQNGAKLTYRVKWVDQWIARKQLVGYSYAATIGSTRVLRRELPELYSPWAPELYCSAAAVAANEKWTGRAAYDRNSFGLVPGYPNRDATKDANLNPTDAHWKENQYQWATISATFSAADFIITSDALIDQSPYFSNEFYRFVSYREDRSANFQTVQGGKLYYIITGVGGTTAGDKATRLIPQGAGKLEAKTSKFFTWHQVAYDALPIVTLENLIGKINKTEFAGCAPGTLLFLPFRSPQRYMMANGALGLDLELCLDFFAPGWLKLLRADLGTIIDYRYATVDPLITTDPVAGSIPAGKFLYDEAEFSAAFDCNNP